MVTILMSDGSEREVPPSPDGVLNVEGDLVNWINSQLFWGLPRQFSLGERLLGGDVPLPADFQAWTLQSIKSVVGLKVAFHNDQREFRLVVEGELTLEAFLRALYTMMNVSSRLIASVTQLGLSVQVLSPIFPVIVTLKPEEKFVLVPYGRQGVHMRVDAGGIGLPIPGTYTAEQILRSLGTLGLFDDARGYSLMVDGRPTNDPVRLRSGMRLAPLPPDDRLAGGRKRSHIVRT